MIPIFIYFLFYVLNSTNPYLKADYCGLCFDTFQLLLLLSLILIRFWQIHFGLQIFNSDVMTQIIRLARKLPTGEVTALKTEAAEEQEEPLDENDLT